MRGWAWMICGLSLAAAGNLRAQESTTEADGRSAELAVSDEALQLRYLTNADVLGRRDNDLAYGLLLTEERDVVGSAQLLLDTDIRLMPRLALQFGPQVYAALLSEENEDAIAMAFGVQARYDLIRKHGIALVGTAFYSPDVLTFGSADNLTDFSAAAEMRLNEQLLAMAGYRWFELDQLQRNDHKLQNELFAGVRWRLR